MSYFNKVARKYEGFTLAELVIVMTGALIILATGVPVLNTVADQYRITLAAQGMASQLHFARMKAVASNEPFMVHFVEGQNFYHVESSDHTVMAGNYYLPIGIDWNTIDSGTGVSFPTDHVMFLPTGNLPVAGAGSAGRVKLISQSGVRIDIVVSNGGIIRQTPPYKSPPAPF